MRVVSIRRRAHPRDDSTTRRVRIQHTGLVARRHRHPSDTRVVVGIASHPIASATLAFGVLHPIAARLVRSFVHSNRARRRRRKAKKIEETSRVFASARTVIVLDVNADMMVKSRPRREIASATRLRRRSRARGRGDPGTDRDSSRVVVGERRTLLFPYANKKEKEDVIDTTVMMMRVR